MINQHGLPRDIPDDVKRAVRQRCRFGCIKCGAIPYQFHHFAPPFSEAREHDPNGITLLCGTHHQGATGDKPTISVATVQKWNANPFGASKEVRATVDLHELRYVVLGTIITRGAGPLLLVGSEEILRVDWVEGEGLSLSARIFDDDGREAVRIRENELTISPHSWDIFMTGSVLTVRKKLRATTLEIRFHSPRDIHIRKLRMTVGGFAFEMDSRGILKVRAPAGGGLNLKDYALAYGNGPVVCKDTGDIVLPSTAMVPFPGDQFHEAAERGAFDEILDKMSPEAADACVGRQAHGASVRRFRQGHGATFSPGSWGQGRG